MEIEVSGIDHIYLAVRDLAHSQRFYDPAMRVLGFRKAVRPLAGGDLHVHYFNRAFQISLRPASPDAPNHDPYAPGLHHLCLRVADHAAVDTIARELAACGIAATPPRLYPQYTDDYYATFFDDPDGLRLEVVNHLPSRQAAAANWADFPKIDA